MLPSTVKDSAGKLAASLDSLERLEFGPKAAAAAAAADAAGVKGDLARETGEGWFADELEVEVECDLMAHLVAEEDRRGWRAAEDRTVHNSEERNLARFEAEVDRLPKLRLGHGGDMMKVSPCSSTFILWRSWRASQSYIASRTEWVNIYSRG